MYAIIQDGGRQYKVAAGDQIWVELRRGAAKTEAGKEIVFDKVLACIGEGGPKIGTPFVPSAKVTAKVLREVKGQKVMTHKYRRREGSSHNRRGHRQKHLIVEIRQIEAGK